MAADLYGTRLKLIKEKEYKAWIKTKLLRNRRRAQLTYLTYAYDKKHKTVWMKLYVLYPGTIKNEFLTLELSFINNWRNFLRSLFYFISYE